MKYFLLFSGIELTAVLLGYLKRPFGQIRWMSRDYTTALKGFSILLVLWVHVGACYRVEGIQFIGTVGVSLFIIFSGYGLQLSVEANSLKGYWKKRFFHIMLPFWIVEGIGLAASGRLTFKVFMMDCLFLKPATGPGWYMPYIMICYLLFFVVKLLVKRMNPDEPERFESITLYGAFLIWFVIDSMFFAIPDMPFLRARQMLCFPFGVSVAKNREVFENAAGRPEPFFLGGFIGLLFMGITQLPAVKELPYIFQNMLSLLTVFPLAIAVLTITKRHLWLVNNWVLEKLGLVSFEIYLVHAFTMKTIQASLCSLVGFIGMTALGAWLLHMLIRKGNQVWSI
ncbi:MAG: acyltransferase [Oscillospiraceae bacterium]|nr:acyltransferase [Oscillospiraceae bacterium]